MRYRMVIQQLMAIGKLLQNSSHANKKNKKQNVTGKGKVTCSKLLMLDVLIRALHYDNVLDKLELMPNI